MDKHSTDTQPADAASGDRLQWIGKSLASDAGVIRLDPQCLAEILALAAELAANPLPIEALHPDDFNLPHCRAMMRRAGELAEDELGFALIDRLPVERMDKDIATKIYWILASMISRPVAQNWKGALIYGVADTTKKKPGNGIRPDVTSAEQNFHTDNSYNTTPPDFVCLLCMQTAKRMLLERDPDLVSRLYEPFLFDRQREHAPDDQQWIENPIFADHDGRLRVRLSAYLVRQGYQLAGKQLDKRGEAALNALTAIVDDADLYKEFYFEPGQIQIVNNRGIGHKRTAFEDWPEPERQRHLVRIWLREKGRRFYHG